MSTSRSMRRELVLTLGAVVAGAVLVLIAAGRPWERAQTRPEPPVPPLTITVSGRDVDPLPTALALVGLAGVLGVAATRRRGRLAVGGLLVAAGIGVVVSAHTADRDAALVDAHFSEADRSPVMGPQGFEVAGRDSTGWLWVSDAGGALLASGGLVVLLRSGGWPAMGARYGAPSAPRRPDAGDLWGRMDRGEDPTDA